MGAGRLELLRGEGSLAEDSASPATARGSEGAFLGDQRVRVVDGALRCIARQGVAKTTLDDVAREARCSRATVYRAIPGGKDALLAAVVDTEVSRLFSALAVRMGEADELEDVLVAGMTEAARRVSAHAALSYLLDHEPSVVLPHLAFERMDALLAVSSTFTAPFLGRWMDHEEAQRVAEWAVRIVLSYLACPADGVDLTDPRSTRHLVRTFVLPGVRAVRTAQDPGSAEGPGTTKAPNRRDAQRRSSRPGRSGDRSGRRSGEAKKGAPGARRAAVTSAASAGRTRSDTTGTPPDGGRPSTTSAHHTDKGEAS